MNDELRIKNNKFALGTFTNIGKHNTHLLEETVNLELLSPHQLKIKKGYSTIVVLYVVEDCF